jgi:hypothetical protein
VDLPALRTKWSIPAAPLQAIIEADIDLEVQVAVGLDRVPLPMPRSSL